jgi:flagellar FliL protein
MADKKPPKEAKKTAPPPDEPKAAPAAEAGGKPAKSGKLKLIIIVVGAMIVGGAGAFFGTRLLGPKAPAQVETGGGGDDFSHTIESVDEEPPIEAPSKSRPEASGGGHGAPAGEEGAAPVQIGPITVDLKPFTTNLNDPSGRRFLKVTIGMEVDDQAGADELQRMLPDIQDSVLILLSSQSVDDIGTVDGKERLRSQILSRTNSFMKEHKVRKIKYSEFIIQ